jgi:hypothetical protein
MRLRKVLTCMMSSLGFTLLLVSILFMTNVATGDDGSGFFGPIQPCETGCNDGCQLRADTECSTGTGGCLTSGNCDGCYCTTNPSGTPPCRCVKN